MKKIFFLVFLLFTNINVFVTNAQRLYNVYWATLSGITENEDIITNNTTTEGYCVSGNQSTSGESGYLEFNNFQNNQTKSIGLTNGSGPIDHCFSFVSNTVSIYKGSSQIVAAYIFNKGDKFKISYTRTTMEFYHNGVLKKSYTYTYSTLKIKVILTTQGASFSGLKTTMSMLYTPQPTDKNYIQTISPLEAVSSIKTAGESRKTGDYLENITYYDGLGRQIQTVGMTQSAMLKDEVQPEYYDILGRKTREYMPYTVKTLSSGSYQSSAINTSTGDPIDQKTFMQPYYSVNNDYQYAFNDINIESCPLNRVMENVGPGADWKGKLSDNTKKSITYGYSSNTENIMLITADVAISPASFYIKGQYVYTPGTLYKTTTTDENNNKTEEYKDIAGRVVLKRSFTGAKKISTYYVYDKIGLLRLVIQPKGAASLETTFATLVAGQQYYIPDNILFTNCFYYEYDQKQRLVVKYIPGSTVKTSGIIKGAVVMVYNNRDQLVMMQDGKLAGQQNWKFIKYDILNRPIMTGTYGSSDSYTREQMQTRVDDPALLPYENRASTGDGYTLNKSWPFDDPAIPYDNLDVQTVTFYDDYNYPGISYSYVNKTGFSNLSTQRVDGKVTGQKIKVLGTSSWLTSINSYDDYGRLIQSSQNNYLAGTDVATIEYSFTGKINNTLHENTVIVSGTTKTYSIKKRFVYDNADRLVDSYEQVNSEPEVLLSRVIYSETSEVKEKNLHIPSTKPALQSIDYSYNIRHWLTGINNTDLNDGEGDLFGMKLMYNDLGSYTSGVKQYNGNISAWEWYGKFTNPVSSTDTYTGKHAYTYAYDGLNRLLTAQYYKNVTRNTGFDYTAVYDDNGNIKTMQQSATGYGQIDNLTYSYDNSEMGNRLRAVGDATTDLTGRGDFFENSGYEGTTATEYIYDDNGNMTEDKNRNIKIQYNEFNLPTLVTIGTNTIVYVYGANGTRLKKAVTNAGTTVNTYYIGEFVYTDAGIAYILTSEGRIVKDGSAHRYEYFLKDHLGNTRMAVTDLGANGTPDLLQEDSYFPFGLKMPGFTALYSGYTGNKYLYNGKEFQDDIAGFGFYDFNGRGNYDPPLGRFHSVDPMSVFTPGISPYTMADDNPVNEVDYYGFGIIDWFKKHVMHNHSMKYYKSKLKSSSFMKTMKGLFGFVDATGNLYRPGSNSNSGSSSSGISTAQSASTNTTPENSKSSFMLDPLRSRTAQLQTQTEEPDLGNLTSEPPTPNYKNKPIKSGTTLPFTEDIQFKGNSDQFYNIDATDKVLSDLISTLQDAPNLTVLIIGNAGTEDYDPTEQYGNSPAALNQTATINGNSGTVRDLMNARAKAVYNYLINHGISPERLKYGPGNRYSNPAGRKTSFVLINP